MSEIKKETTHYIDSNGRHVGLKETIDVRSYERPPKFWKRFEFWIIVIAVAIATVLLGLGGCGQVDSKPMPGPPNNAREYRLTARGETVGGVRVFEFVDSSGRLCVLARYSSYSIALDCVPLAPLDYERLPESSFRRESL